MSDTPRPNFVDLVGYQLEKVHTGVLAWLLDDFTTPLGEDERTSLLRKLAPGLIDDQAVTGVDAHREYAFGRSRRIDLVLKLALEGMPDVFIVMECKTDSDVDFDQLLASRDAVSQEHPCSRVYGLSFAVGTGRFTLANNPDAEGLKDCGILDLEQSIATFSGLSVSGAVSLYDEWITALHAEKSRSDCVYQALAAAESAWAKQLSVAGYRTGFPVYYMVYDKIRQEFDRRKHSGWRVYSAGNNPVLNWGSDSYPVGQDPEVGLYWEFNWDNLCLKAQLGKNGWDTWQRHREAVIDACSTCAVSGRRTANRKGLHVTAYKWELEVTKRSACDVADDTERTIEQLCGKLRELTTS